MRSTARSASPVPSGIAALIIATLPLWVAILGRVFFGVVLTRTIVVGTVIGFAGVAFLVWPSGASGGLDPFGVLLCLLSPVFWATGSLYSRTAHVPRRPLVGTAIQMLAGSAVLFVLATVTGDIFRLRVAGRELDHAREPESPHQGFAARRQCFPMLPRSGCRARRPLPAPLPLDDFAHTVPGRPHRLFEVA